MLLWQWYRPAAAVPIQPLAGELPYAAGAAIKREKKKFFFFMYVCCIPTILGKKSEILYHKTSLTLLLLK